ncbi:MAG: DUF58 domain-containing protein [Planctomycetes bacterium]|nr:DUF58 domain-containing protein [Planctomycetota bacterium]
MNDYLDTAGEGMKLLQALPWLTLVVIFAPIVALASWRKIYPHVPLVLMMVAPCLLTFALLIWEDLFLVVALADVVVVLIAFGDFWTLPRTEAFSAERTATRVASINMPHRITLLINNHSKRPFFVSVRDDIPDEFIAEPEEFSTLMESRSRVTMHYEIRSQRRGAFTLTQVYIRTRSFLGLWRRFLNYPVETVIHVYPDMKQLSEYAILARTNRLSLVGVRRTRKIGQDNEFERLRDYTPDDNYKHIDWRTTARRNKLTVKDFQTNQSQRIIFLLDCGRMMTNNSSGLSLLDHSLNAMLMLSFVALRQGDSVGLVCFSDQIHTFVPPRSGMAQMNRLLHAGFDRFPRLVESRYDEAFVYLDTHCKKRSLVVLMTNLIDEVNSHQVHQYLTNLVGRHLPLGVLLRDHSLFDAADAVDPRIPATDRKLFRAAAAAEILTWRHQVLTDLEHRGVLSLDVFPEDMTAPLVNQYLDIKARHLL